MIRSADRMARATTGRHGEVEVLDGDVVGRIGTVVTRIRGGELPGEVRLPVRGTTELFIAYCPTPVERHETVLVLSSRGNRAVEVEHAPWAAAP